MAAASAVRDRPALGRRAGSPACGVQRGRVRCDAGRLGAAVSDLAAFLAARISEDEAAVGRSRGGSLRGQWPARVLREAEAKRKILAEHWPEHITEGWVACRRCVDWSAGSYGYGNEDEDGEPPDDQSRMNWPCPTLRALAAVYQDHPDYDPQWK